MEKIKILMAEDVKGIRISYQRGIRDDIFDLRLVENGQEAWDEYIAWKPDIVVLDIRMPLLTGFEVLKQIRTHEAKLHTADPANNLRTVIVMATTFDTKEDVMDCTHIGIEGYMVKPIKTAEISQKILAYYTKARPDFKEAIKKKEGTPLD